MFSLVTALVVNAVDAPVRRVTVFSDQARVVRVAEVAPTGGSKQRLEFPLLPASVDQNSIRVESQGVDLQGVTIEPVKPEVFRTAEAKALVQAIDANRLEVSRLRAEVDVYAQQARALGSVNATLPQRDPTKPEARLNAAGWQTSMQFLADQSNKALARQHELELALEAAEDKRTELAAQAAKLGQPSTASGWQVTAQVANAGSAPGQLNLSYVVTQAAWAPQWDLQLLPETNMVSLSLSGLVTQRSQEDWAEAALTLSTAIPSNAVKAPCLTTWKIGTADRFIPTPSPRGDTIAPPPPIVPLTPERAEEQYLRRRLSNALAETESAQERYRQEQQDAARAERETARGLKQSYQSQPKAPRPTRMPSAPAAAAGNFDADERLMLPEEAPAPVAMAPSMSRATESVSLSGRARSATPTVGIGFAPPSAWAPPSYGPDSPVMLAGGYDLSFTSLQRESVNSGDTARRVALWSQQWPVTVERKVYPAIAPEAFLVAELKNPSKQVLPGGAAQLFVGTDPAGTARLKLVAPGESFTLPLGIDRAIKPVRNVKVVDAVQGVISKEDFSTYTLSTELVNPYPQPISIRVFDQIPVSHQKEVEVKLI